MLTVTDEVKTFIKSMVYSSVVEQGFLLGCRESIHVIDTVSIAPSKEADADYLKVRDELVTEDIDGDAIFQVADIRDKYVIMIRKYALEDDRPMKDMDYDLMKWLNDTYLSNLPTDITDHIKTTNKRGAIILPREVEVFGEHRFSDEAEKGRGSIF